MLNFPVKEVNFEKFMRNINSKEALSEVDFIEFFIDPEVKEFIVKNYLNKKYIRIPFIILKEIILMQKLIILIQMNYRK